MDDLISRAEAIKAVEKSRQLNHHTDKKAISAHEHEHRNFMRILTDLPSAQPATSCSEIPNTSDFVSRKAVRDMVATWSYDMAEWEDMELALSDVDKLPSAHPEVIHCKDCKHRDPEDKKCDSGHAIQWQLPRSDDWFCADAERKQK